MMDFTGERYIPELNGPLAFQHYSRYLFAIHSVDLQDKVVLDIASGEGYGAALLGIKARQVYGVDISPEAVETARNRYKSANVEFIQGSASSIPLKSNTVDVVTSFETIEHLSEHDLMLQEIKRVLKTDGILIISTPDKDFYRKNYPGFNNQFHLKELTHKEFEVLLSKFFRHIKFFMQNDFSGTFILPEGSSFSPTLMLTCDRKTLKCEPVEAMYNICIAGDFKNIDSGLVLFFNDSEYLAGLVSDQEQLKRITSKKIWKLYVKSRKFLRWMFT
jgi:ubiquinone/menaquinone biosynthesis C-methylase UbiE